ncbi:MAG: DUF1501 domain-containing protein [Alphaproteobacteria bacterium]|nr:DUF1501 domain-containing protein [Alphaproteobacteria bacterium]MBU1515592.1 DUF1501 domain-containing protein [Alphaproteobacteria bacterium]MBU2096927.1 DUF1501 domain-containing protein [Alphaproteobacteria bacterium]MBU2149582.1 DUF1501 domain-containing protein [Alphaproteobacteria bacterium]MBU2305682.1 DUF1501 domain-containing protein [Alphaproteobacteria bacterium]
MSRTMDRRHMLRLGGAFSMLGTAAPFALQLAAAGSAASQSAPDYKALVCLFLFGGNDSHNMVLATDQDSWGRYFSARNTGADPIALMPVGTAATPVGQTSAVTGRVATANSPEAWGGVLPITPRTAQAIPAGTNASTRTFGLHPFMAPMQTLFSQGRLAVMANVGTLIQPTTKAQYQARSVPLPASLFSHNDQQSTWQAMSTEGARTGWGGRFADLMTGMNGQNTLFTAVSAAGNAVFLSGQSVVQYQLSTGAQPAVVINGQSGTSLFGSTLAPSRVRDLVTDTDLTSNFAADYSTVVSRSIGAATSINSAFTQATVTSVATAPAYTNAQTGRVETNSLALQLQTVARMIAASASLGVRRQVFFVSLGGWDTHDFQNTTQPNLLAKVAHAMSYFDGALANIGGLDRRNQVTTFTASDFARTFTTNGDGTDHAWGAHHFVMGGAVRGGDVYGQYPTLGADVAGFNNPDNINNVTIPTTSVDQYGATLGRWFGVSDSDIDVIFPRLGNFNRRYLDFV